MKISLVVAVAENGVIGADGGLPWRLSTDLRHFRAVTMGKPVIMGRRTWESIGKPLAGRANIVVSRDPRFVAAGADTVRSLDEALRLAEIRARCLGAGGEICIIGGGQLYEEALPIADRLHVTHVAASPEGDTRFGPIEAGEWEAVERHEPPRGEKDSADMAFVTYERRRASGA